MAKVEIPNIAIGAYLIFVVGSSLLVGILPPLVNKPYCKDDPAPASNNVVRIESDVFEREEFEPQSRSSQEILRDFREKVNEKVKRERRNTPEIDNIRNKMRDSYEERAKTNPFVKEHYKTPSKAIPTCPEITNPTQSVFYPWYNPRLPTTVKPLNYDIEIYIPEFELEFYDGYVMIQFDITQQTDTIILHTKLNLPFFQFIGDKNFNIVNVSCVGEYEPNDYFVIKTVTPLTVQNSPYTLAFIFIGVLDLYESGLFEFPFGDGGSKSLMVASKFEPLDARKAFPCFDEPSYKAIFNVTIDHPKGTTVLFNTPSINDEPIPNINNSIRTHFYKTPNMPTYLIGLVVFKVEDFDYVEGKTDTNLPVRLWARKKYIDDGFGKDPLEMAINILNNLVTNLVQITEALPPKIDIFAIPEYEEDAIPHLGLPIFKENRILFKEESASERDKQTIALLIAKQMSEIYFGNYVTFSWWDELWLQEGLGDYMKYRVLQEAYPGWNMYNQFVSEELINVLVEDGYPSSHPVSKPISGAYEIEEYFDGVETSKVAAILRMMEEELSQAIFLTSLKNYLTKNAFGNGKVEDFLNSLGNINNWSAKDFMDRWTKQPNYPLLTIRMFYNPNDNKQYLNVRQSRALNSLYSIFSGELLYPSPYNWTWYVPVTCLFGKGPEDTSNTYLTRYFVDTQDFTTMISNGNRDFDWVHCDRKFAGYFATDYTTDNWESLAKSLQVKNAFFEPLDRANIIHNAFINAFTERNSYQITLDVMYYLTKEEDYIPWKTVSKHLTDMLNVLEYKRAFFQVSQYFKTIMRQVEHTQDLWNPSGAHIEELKKETILELACRIQDPICLTTATDYWQLAAPSIVSGYYNNSLPPYIRPVVYNYHFQNTYNVGDWNELFLAYDVENDVIEQHRYLEALTFIKLPWLLSDFIESQATGRLLFTDFFDAMKLLAKNQLGREIVWDYMRIHWHEIINFYGLEDPRIGHLILDVTSSFENEYIFFELIEFIFLTPSGASANARFKALEIVSTNVVWLEDKLEEIIEVFDGGRKDTNSVRKETPKSAKPSFKTLMFEMLERTMNKKRLTIEDIRK